jgi:hypothetical protein
MNFVSVCHVYSFYYTRWFKYDRDYLCVNKSQFGPVIFEPRCIYTFFCEGEVVGGREGACLYMSVYFQTKICSSQYTQKFHSHEKWGLMY